MSDVGALRRAWAQGRWAKWWILFGLLCRVRPGEAAPLEAEVQINIAAGAARDTLEVFYHQTGWVVFLDDDLGDVKTREVHMRITAEGGLIRLLWHTGLGCVMTLDRTFVIKPLPLLRQSMTHCDRESAHVAPRLQTTSRRSHTQLAGASARTKMDVVPITGTQLPYSDETGSLGMTLSETSYLWLGALTLPQVLRRLPEDFGGGATEDTRAIGAEAMSNTAEGVGINLRGLGSRATLVMLNSRRMAPSGDQGSFVDLLQVPLSAVDHLELLMDSASALYGADAVAGVINIITRQHFPGSRIFADTGGNPDGTQHQYRFGYIGGFDWSSSGGAVVALEDYRRQSLPAARRALASSEISGGPDLGIPYSNPGTLVTSHGTFAVPAGQRSTALDFTSLQAGTRNLTDAFDDTDVLPRQVRDSLYASAHENFTDTIMGSATVLWTERHVHQYQGNQRAYLAIPADTRFLSNVPADAAPLFLQYNLGDALGPLLSETTIRTFNAAGNLDFNLPQGWRLWTSVARSLEQQFAITQHAGSVAVLQSAVSDPDSPMPFNPFDGSQIPADLLAAMRTQPWFGMRSQLWQFNAKAAGPLFSLPGDDVQVAFGGEYRNQILQTGFSDGGNSSPISSESRRSLGAFFGEVKLPIFGAGNAVPGLQKLDLSLAARYEHYSVFGSSVTPRFWVIYSPIESLQIRSSYARSTRAPNLGDLREDGNVSFLKTLADPRATQGSSQVLAWVGGNARLRPEHGISHTLGLRFLPLDTPAFAAEINYFNTVFKDRIQMTGTDPLNAVVPDALENPRYQEIVTRAPPAALQEQICRTTVFPGGQAACLHASIAAIVDLRSRNIATLRTQGLDFLVNWSHQTSMGRFDYNIAGVYRLDYTEKATSGAPEEILLNTPHNPLKLNLLSNIGWRWRGWSVQLVGNYATGYHDPTNLVNPNVRSWMTFDTGLQYELAARPFGWMNKFVVGLNVENLFNRGPPPLVNRKVGLGYDQENGELSGRILRARLALDW